MAIILGIESTCDETAAAIISGNSQKVEILAHIVSSQQKDHEKYGGVVPELAARSHLDNIDIVIKQLFLDAKIQPGEIDAISASSNPGLIGGLIVGNLFAKTMAMVLNKKFIAIDHLEAHVLMPMMNNDIKFPFLALLISGGNTKIIFVQSFQNYRVLSETLDDSLGETFDKVALMLGLNYPGGPLIEKYAMQGDKNKFKMPMPLCEGIEKNNPNFSLSGLKTHIKLLIEKNKDCLNEQLVADICASFQNTITKILIRKIDLAIKNNNLSIKNIVISGGVAANSYIRNSLIDYFHNYNLIFPSREFCTDNGVMIAWNGLLKFEKGFFDTLDSKIFPYSDLNNSYF